MIRLATALDIPNIIPQARKFHQYTLYKNYKFSEDKAKSSLLDFLSSPDSVLLLSVQDNKIVGFLGGTVTSIPFVGVRSAMEILWWMDPDYRGKEGLQLLSAYEYWARNVAKADTVQISRLHDKSTTRFFTKRGYKKEEETWVSQLSV